VEISTGENVVKEKPLYFFLERYTQAYIAEVTQFARAIMENQSVICTGNDGLQAERIAKAAKESLLSGQPVKIEHKKYAVN
jgi:myo-inositol 2-dehydrogenase/D-chiro-inositol 1-dehydrogenase